MSFNSIKIYKQFAFVHTSEHEPGRRPCSALAPARRGAIMFSLFYGLFEYLFRRDEYHVLILGLDKAGKTNVLERLKSMYTQVLGLDPGKILPTVGLNVGRIEAFGHHLVIWDLGGQSGLQTIWDKYYSESHAVVYVVDSANSERFAESKEALDRVLGSSDLHGAPIILMANKQDLPEAQTPHDVAESLGFGRVDNRPTKIVPVCAYTGQGLKESVEWLVAMIKRSERTAQLRHKSAK